MAVSFHTLTRPLSQGAVDLRSVTSSPVPGRSGIVQKPLTFGRFFKKYAVFFVFLVLLAAGLSAAIVYFTAVLTEGRSYEYRIEDTGEHASVTKNNLSP